MTDLTLPNLNKELMEVPDTRPPKREKVSAHKPRILLLYGSTRPRSFSRLLVQEAECMCRSKTATICRDPIIEDIFAQAFTLASR